MRGCEVCISENIMHANLIYWRKKHLKWLDPNSSGIKSFNNHRTRYYQYRDEVIPYRKILNERSMNFWMDIMLQQSKKYKFKYNV